MLNTIRVKVLITPRASLTVTIFLVQRIHSLFYCVFNLKPGFPDPGWKAFYDSATPNAERMPDPWDAVSGLDR